VLVAVAIITFLSKDYFETILILIFLAINLGLEVYQEFHSEKAASLLKKYLVPETRVWREGAPRSVKTTTLVPGDIILLSAGDRISADVRFLETTGITVDESVITGESIAIFKNTAIVKQIGGNLFGASNIGFAGTSVTAGSALALVVATGNATALGDAAHLTFLTEKETIFEKNIRDFSRFLVKLLLAALALVFFLYFVIHGESVAVVEMVLFTLVLAITVVPEALPAITTVALTRGSLALASKKVVVKRLSAIEDLGSIEILCADKTGTLTENHLKVAHVFGEDKKGILSKALLAAQVVPLSLEALHDAFDRALYQNADKALCQQIGKIKRLAEVPFSPQTRMNRVLVEMEKSATLIVRGAPEEILARVVNIDAYTRKQISVWMASAGLRGERVLAVATKENHTVHQGLHITGNLEFQGLISFLDPLKESARETVLEAKALGIQVKIFSGDSKEVVGATAYAVGLTSDATQVITGREFEELSLPEQIHALETGSAFARFAPEQKFAALKLLQKSHAVGFLGEGVNDAPALKLAHVALVVDTASDIAREAADILLLEKDLQVIIDGVREGRKVFANILKYLKITLAANFGNFYSVTLAALFLPFLPLLPLQILLLNLLSDFPMLAIATDRVDHEKLERPNAHNMHSIVVTATLFGLVSSFFDLTVFRLFADGNPGLLQTAWFVFSLLSEILLLYSLRTRRWFFRGAKSSFWVGSFSVAAALAALAIPYTWFGLSLSFTPLSWQTWGILFALLGMYFVVTEVLKHWYYEHMPGVQKHQSSLTH
jgi:Mg2+-importing ATPase